MEYDQHNANYGFISKITDGYDSFCSCSPFIQNCNAEYTEQKPYNALVYLSINNRWCLIESFTIKDKIIDITSENIGLKSNDIAVIIPYEINKEFPKDTQILPHPISLKKDSSSVPPRFKIGFYNTKRSVSYLGEYPKRMSMWKKNSSYVVSNDIRNLMFMNKSSKEDYVLNIVLIPILGNLNTLDWQPKVYVQNTNEINIEITPNKSKLIQIDHLTPPGDKPIEIIGYGFNSIPIFLITDSKGELISIEHTHPPDELYWGKDKFEFLKHYKQNMISR